MKRVASAFKTGLIALIPIFILILIFGWLWSWLTSWAFFDNIFLNFAVNLFGLIAIVCSFGWFLERPWLGWLRRGIRAFSSKIPVISIFVEFAFSDENKPLKKNEFDEVLVRWNEHLWIAGAVTNEQEVVDENGDKAILYTVFVPTVPAPFTGLIFLVKKSGLRYTGRKIGDLALTTASYGLKNLEIKKPLST